VCTNETERRLVTYIQEYKGKWIAVSRVPADVCPICGEQYFEPHTVDKIQKVIYSQKAEKTMDIPLYELEEATG